MAAEISSSDERLRQMFKIGNRFMVMLFRLGLGNWGNAPQTSQVMVLVHKGRKSGLLRKTPVNYAIVDDVIYCTAAFVIASGFAAPLFAGVNPKTLSDEKLAEISAPYRLIRIYPSEACTGPGGPGDLAWVWPASTFILLGVLLLGRRRKAVRP